jgi:predicted nucleotidyltransferase
MSRALDPAAVDLAEELAGLAHVRAVCLLGSVARGDVGPGSDIDLLAVVDARSHVADVRQKATREVGRRRVQTKVLAEERLDEILAARSSFAVHVLREAVVVHDDGQCFEQIRAKYSRDAPIRADPDRLRRRLELYDPLDWCQGHFLYCLSDCYSVGRAAAFALLGERRIFEFSGTRAFGLLAREFPDLEDAAQRLSGLRPFFVLATRDVREALPYPHRGCRAEAQDAVQAAHKLVAAVTSNAR